MKIGTSAVLAAAVLAAVLLAGTASAQYHDSQYLFGGYGSTSTLYAQGPWMADAGNQTFTELAPTGQNWYTAYGMTMDVDNKKVVILPRGTTSTLYQFRSGVFRVDPATQTVSTVYFDAANNEIYSNAGPLHVNQDGDYVFMAYSRAVVASITSYHYRLYQLPSLGGTLTTLLDTTQLGWPSTTTIYQGGQADINTGEYVVQLYNTAANVRYGIHNLSLDGSKLTTWSTGGSYGLYSSYYDGLCQDWSTGNWLSVYGGLIYELTPGTMNRSTLWNLGYPGPVSMYYSGKFDLRSAPTNRVMIGAYWYQTTPSTYYAPVVCAVDMVNPYLVTAVNCDPNQQTAKQYNYPYCFDFYRGRHIQTLKVAPKKWQLRFSCPQFPLTRYVAAISLTGYRPPVTLPDGRKIWLAPDSFTQMSLLGLLKPFFDAGPQTLDASGEAQGWLDFTLLPALDVPLWIALALVDPQAPNGIAYLPDTYVFRAP